MKKNSQTSIEWFVNWFNENQNFDRNDLSEAIKKALEIHKYEIFDAYIWGLSDDAPDGKSKEYAQRHYDKRFKNFEINS